MMLYIQKIYGNERRKEMKVWEVKRQYVTDDACEAGGELRLYDNYEDAHQFYAAVEQDELTYANENNLEIDFDENWFNSWRDGEWWGEHTELSLEEREIDLPETNTQKIGLIYTTSL